MNNENTQTKPLKDMDAREVSIMTFMMVKGLKKSHDTLCKTVYIDHDHRLKDLELQNARENGAKTKQSTTKRDNYILTAIIISLCSVIIAGIGIYVAIKGG